MNSFPSAWYPLSETFQLEDLRKHTTPLILIYGDQCTLRMTTFRVDFFFVRLEPCTGF